MAKENTSSIAFEADVSQFTQSINKMRDDIKLINSSFEASASEMDDWANSSEGLEKKIKSLNDVLADEKQKLADMEARRNEYVATLDKNKKKLAELEAEYKKVVAAEGDSSANAKKLVKQRATLQTAITKNEKAINNESITINKQITTINKTNKSLKTYQDELKNVGKKAKDSEKNIKDFGDSTSSLKGALSGIGKGIAVGIAAIGTAAASAATAFLSLAESTREYRTELAKLKTVSDTANANFEETKEAYQDLVAVTNDEGAATEAINNLLTAGFKGDELEEVNQYIQGAAIKWKDTLKAEGLSDSIQEWIGSGGESLTGNIAEMLERLGYNLEEVKEETAGYSEEQRRAYLMNIMQKEGLGEVAEAYKKENKTLYEASLAQQNLTDKMAVLGESADKITTILKNKLASGLEGITPTVLKVSEAFEKILSGDMTGFDSLGEMFLSLREKANEAFTGMLDGLTEIIPELLPKIAEFLSQAIQQVVEFAPTLLESALQLFGALIEALPPTITKLIEEFPKVLDGILESLNEMIPSLLEAGIQFLGSLIDALPTVIDALAEALPQILAKITEFIQQNIPILLEKFGEFLGTLVEAIPNLIQKLADALPNIIGSIVSFIADNLPTILNSGIDMFNQIVAAIPVLITKLAAKLPTIISKITQTLYANAPKILTMAVDLFMNIVTAIPKMIIELGKNLPEIITTILKAFKDAPTMLKTVGEDIIKGLWEGIKGLKDWLKKKLESAADWLPKWVKDKLGIASPSKVFKEIGKFSADGLGVGFTDEMKKVKKSIVSAVDMDGVGINSNVSIGTTTNRSVAERASKNVTLNYTVNSPKALSRREIYLQQKKMATILGGVS